jgi:predicted RNase H-like nuclease (RuvC/YqgF family)
MLSSQITYYSSSFQIRLPKRIDSLQSTLLQVRRETEEEITRLRDELHSKNRMLERLETQLRDQTDYAEMKRQCE